MEDSRFRVSDSEFRAPGMLFRNTAHSDPGTGNSEPGTGNSIDFLVMQCFTSRLFPNHEFSYLDRCDLARRTTPVPWSRLELSGYPRFCRPLHFWRAIFSSMDCFREKKTERCTGFLLVPEYIGRDIARAIFRFSARSGWTCRSAFRDVCLRKKPQHHS
jgi:hypothetical protein